MGLAQEKEKAVATLETERAEQRESLKKRTQEYEKEYAANEKQLVDLRREAKLGGNFFVEPEAKLIFIVRIVGIIKMSPKPRKVLQLVQPYVTYGYPTLRSVRELVYKRGFGKVNK